MKRILLSVLMVTALLNSFAAPLITLTDSTKFSLLTCSPGPVAYEKFGHTAIRILDTSQSVDLIANWGIFDFDKPGFYYKFVKGETYYKLGVHETYYFLESYRQRNSSVTEQVLNLTEPEKQRLLSAISTNYLPENQEYLYNFVFDNCATRPFILINEVVAPKVIKSVNGVENKTFREWVATYTGKFSWLQFGIDLVFGKEADRLATPTQVMFLPEELCKAYTGSMITDENNVQAPFVSDQHFLVEKTTEKITAHSFSLPFIITLILLIVGLLITFVEYRKKKHSKSLDFILFLVTGFAGLIIFYLMFFSIHPLVKMNFNILWCSPFNLIAAFLLLSKKFRKPVIIYTIFYAISVIIAFVVAAVGIQVFNIAFLPIMALLLIRSLVWLRFNRLGHR